MQIDHSFYEGRRVMQHAHPQYCTTPAFQRTLGLSQGTSPKSTNDKSLAISMVGSESHSRVMASMNRPARVIVIGGR